MSKEQRKSQIVDILSQNEKETIASLSKQVKVSEMTVRRYLKELEDEKIILGTTYGYILVDQISSEIPFLKKQLIKVEEKNEIAQKALKLIKPNQHILLDAGTTTYELAKLLKDEKYHLTIITNDIKSASLLVDSHHTIILTGGILQRNVGSIYGMPTIEYLKRTHVDVAFVASEAVYDNAIYAPTDEKATVKQLMITSGCKVYLLVDESKFSKRSYCKISELAEFDGIIINNDFNTVLKNELSQITSIY